MELWSGVAQYCLLVGNYNSATAILESLESPAIARLKVTVSVGVIVPQSRSHSRGVHEIRSNILFELFTDPTKHKK